MQAVQMADFGIWCREPDDGRRVTAYKSCVAMTLPSQTYLRSFPSVPSNGPHQPIIISDYFVLNALVPKIEGTFTPG